MVKYNFGIFKNIIQSIVDGNVTIFHLFTSENVKCKIHILILKYAWQHCSHINEFKTPVIVTFIGHWGNE